MDGWMDGMDGWIDRFVYFRLLHILNYKWGQYYMILTTRLITQIY